MLEQDVLLDLLARKDNRAYQYLYQCYYVALKALANHYVKDNDVAEDLVQDVFISLLESDYKFKTENDIFPDIRLFPFRQNEDDARIHSSNRFV